jgi:hypothetical protein
MANITLIQDERIISSDGEKHRILILADDTPSSLSMTGADVPGLNSTDVIAAGSVLIAPHANYIAFTDGEFTLKG